MGYIYYFTKNKKEINIIIVIYDIKLNINN